MDKLLQLISIWKRHFEPSKDLLPQFFEFYAKVQSKGIEFPPAYDSKYQHLQKKRVERKPAVSQSASVSYFLTSFSHKKVDKNLVN